MDLRQQIFGDFNFSNVRDPGFKEDSVREEIIAPLLRSLGYRSDGTHRIHRSKPLLHPYVMFGSQKRRVNIIPDYLISVDDKFCFVLDAKSPGEDILAGDHVSQAYSYAIHPEVRAWNYGLCNGETLSLFEIMSVKPKHVYDLRNQTDTMLLDIKQKLNPRTISANEIFDYRLDGGTYMSFVMGITPATVMHFPGIPITNLGLVQERLYSMSATPTNMADRDLAITFDFDQKMFDKLMQSIPKSFAEAIQSGLKRQPFMYKENNNPAFIGVSCRLSRDAQFSMTGEMFIPLEIVDFFPVD